MPTSLAMLVGRPVSEIIPKYGHDGSDVVVGNPYNRRCFTDLETVRVALDMGVHLVPISPYLRIPEEGTIDPTFVRMLERYSGLLVGNWCGRTVGHCLHWSNRHYHALDPSTPEAIWYGHLYERWNVEVFFAWVNRPSI